MTLLLMLACMAPSPSHTTVVYVSVPAGEEADDLPCEVPQDVQELIQVEEHWAEIRWLALRSASEGLDDDERAHIQDTFEGRVEALARLGWEIDTGSIDLSTAVGARQVLEPVTGELDAIDAVLDLDAPECAERVDADGLAYDALATNVDDGLEFASVHLEADEHVESILERIRELAVQSASETLDDDERAYIQDEFEAWATEIARTANVTQQHGISLADGTNTVIEVQSGMGADELDRVRVTLGDLRTTVLGVDTASLDLSYATGAQSAIDSLDTALDTTASYRSDVGAAQLVLESEAQRIADLSD